MNSVNNLIVYLPYIQRKLFWSAQTQLNYSIRAYEFNKKKQLKSEDKELIRFIFFFRTFNDIFSNLFKAHVSTISELKKYDIDNIQYGNLEIKIDGDEFTETWRSIHDYLYKFAEQNKLLPFLNKELTVGQLIDELKKAEII